MEHPTNLRALQNALDSRSPVANIIVVRGLYDDDCQTPCVLDMRQSR